MTTADFEIMEGRYKRARADLIRINKIIYAQGAPLGSENYHRIRYIASQYEREERSEKAK